MRRERERERAKGGEKDVCVCVQWTENEVGLRVNVHHCRRLIFHQTARSMQRLPRASGHDRAEARGESSGSQVRGVRHLEKEEVK